MMVNTQGQIDSVQLDISSRSTSSGNVAPFEDLESRYRANMQAALNQVHQIKQAHIVIGIPFYNEYHTLPNVIETACNGIKTYYQNMRAVIVSVGSPAGGSALEVISALSRHPSIEQISFILKDELLNGKGWCIRAIFDVADKLGADVVLLEADVENRSINGVTEGLDPRWVYLLFEPIKTDIADMVVSRFNTHPFDTLVCNHLAYPLLTAIYNRPIRCLTGGQIGIAHHLLRTYLNNAQYAWETAFSGYGVDTWLATAAITHNARICEADLGVKIHKRSGGKEDVILRQLIKAFFHEILNDKDWWTMDGIKEPIPTYVRMPVVGMPSVTVPDSFEVNPHFHIQKYQMGFNNFSSLYQRIFSEKAYGELENLSHPETEIFDFKPQLWVELVYTLLLSYAFRKDFTKGDLLNALVPLHDGFVASRIKQLDELSNKLAELSTEERSRIISIHTENEIEELANEFRRQRGSLIDRWGKEVTLLEPPVPSITFREFIPGIPLIVPAEIIGKQGNLVTANGIYNNIFAQLKSEFEEFIFGWLKVAKDASSLDITLAIKDFLRSVEETFLAESDLSIVDGTKETIRNIFDMFPRYDSFSLLPNTATELLCKYPPHALITRLGHTNLADLLKENDPCDILSLARWAEDRDYLEALWEYMSEELDSESFGCTDIKFIVVKHEDFPSLAELRNSTALDKLTSRIVVSNLHKGMGGEFPKLRYFTTIAKDIVEAERFGQIWQRFARDRKDFGRKVINSLRGHWGREPLSAHNIFEDGNQRILVDRLNVMADQIANEGNQTLAEKLKAIANSYHLALILPDNKFITCSAWSWASYSFKGGTASPPPLSTHVERDWASREFLIEYYKAIGGNEDEVEEKIIELMANGKESENLAPILLGTEREVESIVPSRSGANIPEPPIAGTLIRFEGNPILQPIQDNPWESKYVLNAGAIRLENRVYLAYRAHGDDEISRIGLAISEDGFNFSERLSKPIFQPRGRHDQKGCEDPRFILIDNRIYMTYVVFDGTIAQIALSSISKEDFVANNWKAWRHHGLIFPKFTDKDAALFPEKFDGKYAMLHRVDPHIWITFSSHLRGPWSRKEHMILAGSTSGMMWDGLKIGAGTQPIKTEYGWLLITHGVDYNHVYRLGVMLLDLSDPSRLIYRSPNPVLEPASEWETGKNGVSWTSNVVFTCGAIPRWTNKEILNEDDELIVYYGAADSVVCAATTTIHALIPRMYRG